MQIHKSALLFLFLILFSINTEANVFIQDEDVFFHDDIQSTINITGDLSFYVITVHEEYIHFNNSSFFINNINPVNITMRFLHEDTLNQTRNTTIMEFEMNTTSIVFANISGLYPTANYSLYVDDVFYDVIQANQTGNITFNYSEWDITNHIFTIILLNPGTNIRNIRYIGKTLAMGSILLLAIPLYFIWKRRKKYFWNNKMYQMWK